MPRLQKIQLRTGSTAPSAGDFDISEPAWDATNKRLYIKASDGSMAPVGVTPTLLYNRRPPMHRGPLFSKTSATAISIAAGAVLNGIVYATATPVTMPGSFTNNTDYAIWQHPTTGALVADASFLTAPTGATGGSIVGGFHYIPSGRPTGLNNASPMTTAEILEFSLWDLTWRPQCPDPRGMVCIEGSFWADMYMASTTAYAGSTFSAVPSSRFALTIADGDSLPLVPAGFGGNGSTAQTRFSMYEAAEMAYSFGKRLLTYEEFSAAAYGAPEGTSRGSDAGTVQWERVSLRGLAQATGVMWIWSTQICNTATDTSSEFGPGRGAVGGPSTRALLLSGSWGAFSTAGSRSAGWFNTPWSSGSDRGARFAADHYILG